MISWASGGANIVPLHMHLLPTGNVLARGRAGQPYVWTPPADDNPAGAGSFVKVEVPDAWTTGPSHLWPYNRDYGSAVMYDDDKILYAGGGGDPKTNSSQGHDDPKSSVPTNTAEKIDLSLGNAASWQSTGSIQLRPRTPRRERRRKYAAA